MPAQPRDSAAVAPIALTVLGGGLGQCASAVSKY